MRTVGHRRHRRRSNRGCFHAFQDDIGVLMNKKEVKHIISQLKKSEICIRDIPEEYRENDDIVNIERKIGLRKNYRCGFDVISGRFFAEEDILYRSEEFGWSHLDPQYFDDFDSYYKYLDGNIYDNACYFLLDPIKLPDYVDQNKLYERTIR